MSQTFSTQTKSLRPSWRRIHIHLFVNLAAHCKLTVLSKHHHDLRVCEFSSFDPQRELAHRLPHFWILYSRTAADWTLAPPIWTHLFIQEDMNTLPPPPKKKYTHVRHPNHFDQRKMKRMNERKQFAQGINGKGLTDLVVPESLHLLLIGCLSHLEDQWSLTKPEILCRDIAVQKDVDPWNQTQSGWNCCYFCGKGALVVFCVLQLHRYCDVLLVGLVIYWLLQNFWIILPLSWEKVLHMVCWDAHPYK